MVWLTRNRHGKKPRSSWTFWKPTFTRLTVTRLEGRDNPAPTISNLTGQQIGGTWVITGQVNDTNPGRDTVTISGDTNGAAHVYDDGWFDYLVAANGSSTVSAQATDPSGNQSSTSSTSVTAPSGSVAPHLTLAVSYGQQRSVTLTGKGTGTSSVSGLSVTFSGEVSGRVMTSSDGSFSYSTSALALGTISGSTTDWLGAASNVPVIRLVSNAPTITLNATWIAGTMWKLSGTVTDECAPELGVSFDGLVTTSTVVHADRTFVCYVTIPPGTHATITAQTTHCWCFQSNIASVSI